MNTIKKLIAGLFFLFIGELQAQNNFPDPNQNVSHPTIDGLKVMYKAIPQGTLMQIQAIPEGKVVLKPNVNVAVIYLKILSPVDNSILYQVNYQTNAATVTNNDGRKLFENSNGVIFISNGQGVSLKPYLYQLQTEDSNGNLSQVFSIIQ
jgi:hypothetical protein